MTLTPAQQKALDWLPSDGSWVALSPHREPFVGAILKRQLIEAKIDKHRLVYRLTSKGIAYKAGRES